MKQRGITKKQLESLILSGALDTLSGNRFEKYKSIEKNKKPRRFYFCKDCGSYHLTHMLYWDTDEKSKKKIKEKNNFDKNKLKRLEKTWNF